MDLKLLRRKVAIRDRDYEMVLSKDARSAGYTGIKWEPYSIDQITKEVMLHLLAGTSDNNLFLTKKEIKQQDLIGSVNSRISNTPDFADGEFCARWLIRHLASTGHMYKDYKHWMWEFDVGGDQILLRYRNNLPWSRLGIAVLEMRY